MLELSLKSMVSSLGWYGNCMNGASQLYGAGASPVALHQVV